MPARTVIDAIVLAEGPLANVRIAGLTARERAVRVAGKFGARRTWVVDGGEARAQLAAWRGAGSGGALLVIRADQLVHTPLVEDLPHDASALAVDPETRAYAGAFVAVDRDASEAAAELARGVSDEEFAARLAARGAARVPHGAIARAPIATPAERRAAHHLLYKILVKPQDNAITRYVYRPVSFPLTRLLVWTPVTPNQISYVVAALVAIGCWITAHASAGSAFAGTGVVLAASYLDCCDGEVARVKLLSSRFGAWIDTIVDELSSVGYMIALGWHCHLKFGPAWFGAPPPPFDPWLVAIVLGTVTFLGAIYFIYYSLIVAIGSANSQDYVGRFEIAPGDQPNTVRLRPAAPAAIAPARELPPPLAWLAKYAPYVVRRDFISWGTFILAGVGWTHISFAILVAGGVVTFVITSRDHVRLRTLRRDIERQGLVVETP